MRLRRLAWSLCFVALGLVFSGCAGSKTSVGGAIPPNIQSQPSNQTVIVGQTATFSVVVSGTAPLSYQWQKGTAAISGATSANYTTPATALGDSGSTYSVVVSNSAGNVTSNTATLTVNKATAGGSTDVLTYDNDVARSGQNLRKLC